MKNRTRQGLLSTSLTLAGLAFLMACTQPHARGPGNVDGLPFSRAVAGTCTDAWCVSQVLAPTAQHFLPGVWASGPRDAWVVDHVGDMLHWNGDAWAIARTPSLARGTDLPSSLGALTSHFSSVWGTGANDVWAAAWNGVQHWDGATWTLSLDGNETVGIGGTGPHDVWAVGPSPVDMWHWTGLDDGDGIGWRPREVGGFDGAMEQVWGSAPNDVWVVGSPGISHYDGTRWSKAQQPFFASRAMHLEQRFGQCLARG